MFLVIENFLVAEEMKTLLELGRQVKYVEGRRSNPHSLVKNNLIGDPEDPYAQRAGQIGLAALQRNEEARNFVFPQRVAVPSLACYRPGMNYGAHIDAAFMPIGAQPLRADVSCTIFISAPTEYEGGELVIFFGSRMLPIKGNPGSAVFYPSNFLHQVAPVTSGERLVMITFIESQIMDPMQRNLLHTLGEIRALEGMKMDWRTRTQLEYVIANVHRMWSK